MASYVTCVTALSSAGLCPVPFRESICLSMAAVGFVCLVAAWKLVTREQGGLDLVPVERE